MNLFSVLQSSSWKTIHSQEISGREGRTRPLGDLGLAAAARRFVESTRPGGLYEHQHEAIRRFLDGENVCTATSTGSGKSMSFHACAIDRLARNPESRVLAVYPMKALGAEQIERWDQALDASGLGGSAGRVDGSVKVRDRVAVLRDHRVIVATPDILHAWLLPASGEAEVRRFLSNLELVVIDEVHEYTGVMGSNAAYVFRRLRHLAGTQGAAPRFIAASATIAEPVEHLRRLTGLLFSLIGMDADSSPRRNQQLRFVEPPAGVDELTAIADLLRTIARDTDHRFLAFVDSRKMAEQVSVMVNRMQGRRRTAKDNAQMDADGDGADSEEPGESAPPVGALPENRDVMPYRSGYEEMDRREIQRRLSTGKLAGVVSTSALELGIDVAGLTLGILIGVPASITSLHQRIGRIGRHQDGEVLVINTGDVLGRSVERDPGRLLEMPPVEGALYLENPRIQYIHAMCLARPGGEHDAILGHASGGTGSEAEEAYDDGGPFTSETEWPEGFLDLCEQERVGNIPRDLQGMKMDAGGDAPQHVFPLRDVEQQFSVRLGEMPAAPDCERLGSLSYAQVLREAYPGAIYYYVGKPYRVVRVNHSTRQVRVRRERHRYTTTPVRLRPIVRPNLAVGEACRVERRGDLVTAQAPLQIQEVITGYRERRGSQLMEVPYPLSGSDGVFWDNATFSRNYFTTGVLLRHPVLDEKAVHTDAIAVAVFEAFLMTVGFERQELNYATGRFRQRARGCPEGGRFVALYDQTYGSLHLATRLLEDGVLPRVLEGAVDLVRNGAIDNAGSLEAEALELLARASMQTGNVIQGWDGEAPPAAPAPSGTDGGFIVPALVPGSLGIDTRNGHQMIRIETVDFHPTEGQVMYRGRREGEQRGVTICAPLSHVQGVPGESRMGRYDVLNRTFIPPDDCFERAGHAVAAEA